MELWTHYLTPTSLDEAVSMLSQHSGDARIVAGATDLILELERGQRPSIKTLIDITRIPGLDQIQVDDSGRAHLGPLVTHNHCAASALIQDRAYCLARACWEVGAPQIRNRATVAGNLITASPANDSITPLMAMGAAVTLRGADGERVVPLSEFYTGVRQTVMQPGELLVDISFPLPSEGARSGFYKLGLRRAQAISIINVAIVLEMDGYRIESATITLGSVAPVIVHADAAESYLAGKTLSEDTIAQAGKLAQQSAKPIDDLRGSEGYRREMVRTATVRVLRSIQGGREREGLPEDPVMLWGPGEYHWDDPLPASFQHDGERPIETTINGRPFSFSSGQGKTLLRLLREEGELIGTKEGCAEGECGACTVFLDGLAVMACMVPAPRAHHAEIVTIEGLAENGKLHPVQQAFIETGAVQCGYCTPGFIMSGAKLLEERPQPNRWEAKQAITGNLCRCTGYYKILDALERAGADGS
ncbi:MAG: FAD binding domain-containing protein [Anaerolineales bacterium]